MSGTDTNQILPENPMLKAKLEKVTVNMAVGKSGEPLDKASKILEQLTEQKPSKRKAKKTIRDFGIRKGEPISCMVTLRGPKSTAFLSKAFKAVDNKLSENNFDNYGNFSFGIKEHIDIPGTKYEPSLGIFGMDVCVSVGRAGYRVKRRHHTKSRVGSKHMLTREDGIRFAREDLGVEVS